MEGHCSTGQSSQCSSANGKRRFNTIDRKNFDRKVNGI